MLGVASSIKKLHIYNNTCSFVGGTHQHVCSAQGHEFGPLGAGTIRPLSAAWTYFWKGTPKGMGPFNPLSLLVGCSSIIGTDFSVELVLPVLLTGRSDNKSTVSPWASVLKFTLVFCCNVILFVHIFEWWCSMWFEHILTFCFFFPHVEARWLYLPCFRLP